MVNQQVVDYIKSVRKRGFSDKSIKAHLIQNGYNSEEVDEAFKALSSRFPVIPLIIFLILIGVGMAVFVLLSSTEPDALYDCPGVNLGIYNLKGQEVICVYPDNSKMQMILENRGEKTIWGVDIEVKGKNGKRGENLDNLNLVTISPQNIFTKVVDLNIGEVEEVKLTPTMQVNNTKVLCTAQRITPQIRTC